MIEVFKTNVQKSAEAKKLLALLQEEFPGTRINFDLHDCDKILRIEGLHIAREKLKSLVSQNGFTCIELE